MSKKKTTEIVGSGNVTVPVIDMPKEMADQLKNKKIINRINRSTQMEVELTNPTEFFKKIDTPAESRLYKFVQEVKEKSEEQLDQHGISKVMEINHDTGQWRWRIVRTTAQLKAVIATSEAAHGHFLLERERKMAERFRKKSRNKEGFSFGDDTAFPSSNGAQPYRDQFTPLLGTPFFKQMYLYDYWEMHSKCFWYSNYSGIGKFVVDTTRNFVMGKGFNISFKNQKHYNIWQAYEDRNYFQESVRLWCDDLTKFGENMVRKTYTKKGIAHKNFDPSTIWEIVTDPENINDIKYYHQQYNTQYQLYTTPSTPSSKYVLNQLPPEIVMHNKVNVTAFEKRGRSDMLAILLYLKYYEDYAQSRLLRGKNEAAFIWDVTVKGSDEDVSAYIANSENISDVPPGSENVHNEAIERKPLSPQFGQQSTDQMALDILSYVAMGTTIPMSYFGTGLVTGGSRAGAIVATEPVIKKMIERQLKMEYVIRQVVLDVMKDAGQKISPDDYEINMPEIFEEDRSKKINDLVIAKTEGVFTHRRMSEMIAKEFRVSKYDYEQEQKDIKAEQSTQGLFQNPDTAAVDTTQPQPGEDDGSGDDNSGADNDSADDGSRVFDRTGTKKDLQTL